MSILPYGRQAIDDDDIAAVVAALKGDYLTTGPLVEEFDRAFAEKTGAAYAVSCNSGTAALHMAVRAMGLGPGQAAIVPAITFVATANAVRFVGAEPIFADVDPATGLMGPQQLEMALGKARAHLPFLDVRAVLPVHLAGQCADPEGIAALAADQGLTVIDDACHALGTTYDDDVKIGSNKHAVMSCFSFHPVKTIAMGEGGAVTTNDTDLAARLKRYRSHGITREASGFNNTALAFDEHGQPNPWYYELNEIMPNYRAPDILCALGISQLKKLDAFGKTRRAIATHYDRLLEPLAPLVEVPQRVPGNNPLWHLYAVRIDFAALGLSRTEIIRQMAARGVGTQVHYVPVPWQPYYAARNGNLSTQDFPGAAHYYARTLSLPMFAGMTEADAEHVVDTLRDVLGFGHPKMARGGELA